MDVKVKGWLKKQPVVRQGGSRLKQKIGSAKRRYFVFYCGEESSNLVYYAGEQRKKEKGRLVVTGHSTVQPRLANASFEVWMPIFFFCLLA